MMSIRYFMGFREILWLNLWSEHMIIVYLLILAFTLLFGLFYNIKNIYNNSKIQKNYVLSLRWQLNQKSIRKNSK